MIVAVIVVFTIKLFLLIIVANFLGNLRVKVFSNSNMINQMIKN